MSGAGGELLGNNVFIYCFNNPVNMSDSSGYWPQWINNSVRAVAGFVTKVKAVLSIPTTIVKIAVASTVAVASGQATVGDIVKDAKNYDFFNTDETKVLDSKVFSSYNGTPVLRHDVVDGSMSVFNTIFLRRGATVDTGGAETIRHEWGHTVQQSLMGTPKFLIRIAIPSLIGASLYVDDYYSQPWERSADFFGGATHTYSEDSGFWAWLYFLMP